MTIFDSIKYPISDQPTYDELEAIPVEIWLDFLYRAIDVNSERLPSTLAFMYMSSAAWKVRVELLKRTILEYET